MQSADHTNYQPSVDIAGAAAKATALARTAAAARDDSTAGALPTPTHLSNNAPIDSANTDSNGGAAAQWSTGENNAATPAASSNGDVHGVFVEYDLLYMTMH